MRMRRTQLGWVMVSLALVALAAVACSSSATPARGPTSTAQPEPTATTIPTVTPTQIPAAADIQEAARQEYAAAVREIQERVEAKAEKIFEPVERAGPPPAAFGALVEALPQVIEATQSNIAELKGLTVPEEYSADHQRAITFLEAQIDFSLRELEAVEARDELKFREIMVEREMLDRNMLSSLSESFLEFFLVSEEASEFAQVFAGLSEEESAYLDTVAMGFEEFAKRNAVFGQVLSRQFADTRVLLEALKGAGAGTAFEAVQAVIAAAQPPPRFEADHALLLSYLDESVRLDREIGKAIEEGNPVHFVVSNFQLGFNEAAVRGALEHSPQVREIARRPVAFALREPGPEVLDGGYREGVYGILREFRVRFPMTGPNYLAFNLLPEDAYQVVSRTAPGFITVIETARDRFAALSPPAELHDDHELLVQYFEETVAAQRAVLNAAAAEDFGGLREGMGQTGFVFCETATGISDEMKPVVAVQFGGPPDDSGLPDICGPGP